MGGSHAHAHGHGAGPRVATAYVPRVVLLAGLAAVALATVAGLFALWPDGSQPKATYAAEGVTFPEATVMKVHEPCPVIIADPAAPPEDRVDFPESCDQIEVELASGERHSLQAPPGVVTSGLRAGDRVKLIAIPAADGRPAVHEYFGTVRNFPLGLMTVFFVVVVGAVARLRGLLALVGLAIAGLVVWKFMLPSLLDGSSGIGVALVASAAIMFVVLYLAHGPSVRTSTALAGTLIGVGISAVLSWYAVGAARLSGMGGESSELLRAQAPDLDFGGLLTCGIIVAGLGVLNDVTITQSSAVWELRAAGPELSRRQLFTSGMRIGRDHIASTIYTIVFVYAGTALTTLLLVSLYARSPGDVLNDEIFAEEIMRTLASAIGLVLAVPATTAIAVATVRGPTGSAGSA